MQDAAQVAPQIYSFTAHMPVPNIGVLPVNSYLIQGDEPTLIDTNMEIEREDYLKNLWSLVDPDELRWIVISHDDNDHAGNLRAVMDAAPNARVAFNWLAKARIDDHWDIPMDRVFFLNPGQSLRTADRELVTVRPPIFDSPASLGIYDSATGTFFGGDSFGSIIPEPAENIRDVSQQDYEDGFRLFNSLLSPWTQLVDQHKFDATIEAVARFKPKTILSGHAPAAEGMSDQLMQLMSTIPQVEPFVGPDQTAVEAILAQFEG